MNKFLLVVYIITILILSILKCSFGKIVFIPGSDMGYILPDNENENKAVITGSEEAENIKRKTKRAFMNTIFDGLAGINEFERLSQSVKKDQRNEDPPMTGTGELPEYLKDSQHGVAMGISDKLCDDGRTNLEVDWNGSPTDYTCYTPKSRLEIRDDLSPVEECDDVPAKYIPMHYCMHEKIQYNSSIPTYGPHRPLWPIFGEYNFVPPQRWLHNIEHGSIVFLYHPCTHPILVMNVKKLIKKCIFKHVIAASTSLSLERPMVLIAWGCKLEFSYLDEPKIIDFIKTRALKGPEGLVSKQGQYSEELLFPASPPKGSNIDDEHLCPNL